MDSTSVEVWRNGQHTLVLPPVEDLMWAFKTTIHEAMDDARHGVKIVRQPFPLVWPGDLRGTAATETYAGLEPQVTSILEAAGYKVRLRGDRPGPLPRPLRPKSGGSAPDQAMLEFIFLRERGLIRYDPAHVRVERLVAQIAEAYPEARILVVAAKQNDVLYLSQRLTERGIPVGRATYDRQSPGAYRVAVVTFSCVGKGLADAANRDIVVYLNPTEAFGYWGRLSLGAIGPARLYGMMPVGFEPPSPVDGLVASVFGEESIFVPQHGSTARPVQVLFVSTRVQARLVHRESDLDARRRLIWHHEVRNRRVAQIAKACLRGDYDKLDEILPGLGRAARRQEDGYVAVLLDSLEHAVALRRHLPGWPVIANGNIDSRGLTASDISRISSMEASDNKLPRSAIVTASAMPNAVWFNIIIRADAGLDQPALGGWHLLGDYRADDNLLLVDLDDRHHPLARKWTRSRKAAYTAAGWPVAGGPEVYVEDRMHRSGRAREPILPYQTPGGNHRPVEGEYRTPQYQYETRRQRRREHLRELDGGQITLRQIADPDHLAHCFRKLVREGGPAAGIDGISPRDIAMSDFCGATKEQKRDGRPDIVTALSKALLEKRWRPQKTRLQPIPKPGTDEKRMLKIGVTVDRNVGKALHEALQPFWEKHYLRNSFGFRPGRSVWQMVAEVIATMEKYDRRVLVIADVRKAFDNVPIREAIKAHQVAVENKSKGKQPILADDVVELIETVLRGHDEAHEVGIDQGGCYSPDALNILLHTVHDSPLDAVDDATLWFRYADNLAYVVQSVTEGHRVLARVRRLLRKAGLSLKGDERVVDLNTAVDNPAIVLGFSLWREDGRLRIGPRQDYLSRVGEHLVTAWETSDPNMTAKTILRGWISANGLAFENGVAVIADVLRLSSRLGFRELPGPDVLTGWWEESWQRWQRCFRHARRRVLRRVRH